MMHRLGHYDGMSKKTTESILDVYMEKDGACKMDRQNEKCVLRRVGDGRIVLELIKKRKRNWLGHWLRSNCLLKDALKRSGKREERSWQKKISDD